MPAMKAFERNLGPVWIIQKHTGVRLIAHYCHDHPWSWPPFGMGHSLLAVTLDLTRLKNPSHTICPIFPSTCLL
jgi:hypothetical protein